MAPTSKSKAKAKSKRKPTEDEHKPLTPSDYLLLSEMLLRLRLLEQTVMETFLGDDSDRPRMALRFGKEIDRISIFPFLKSRCSFPYCHSVVAGKCELCDLVQAHQETVNIINQRRSNAR